MNKKTLLLLGCTGKLGTALKEVFKNDYLVIEKCSADFNALNFEQVQNQIEIYDADIVLNTIALVGIDSCEREPEKALRLNTLYPKFLAELSNKIGFLLVHFSSDAVFNDQKRDAYVEQDCPAPLNTYGLTKYGGDLFVQKIARRYYIFRLSILFGETTKNTQFVEKMLQKIKEGQTVLDVADDIISSPTFNKDAAKEVRKIIEAEKLFGLYHIANKGIGSLYDLIEDIVKNMNLQVKVRRASYLDFPYCEDKNRYTPIKSEKLDPLRPWREAVKEYCTELLANMPVS